MNIKKFLSAIFSCVLAFSLTACNVTINNGGGGSNAGGGGDDSELSGEPVYVTVVDAGLGSKWMEKAASAYYDETGITVEVTADPDLVSSVETKMSSSTAETDDLYFVAQANNLWLTYAAKERIYPLNDVLESDKYGTPAITRVIDDKAIGMGKYLDEKILTVPYVYTCWGFVYNQNYLDKIESFGQYKKGEFPKTVQGILDLCEAVNKSDLVSPRTKNKVKPLSAGLNVDYMNHLFFSLWHELDPEGFAAYYDQTDTSGYRGELLNTESFKKAMGVCFDIIGAKSKTESNLVSSAQNHLESQQSFVNGDCVFTISGSWFESEMREIMEEVNLTNYRFADFPVFNEGDTPSLGINYPGENFFVPKNAVNPAGAKDFLAFLMSEKCVSIVENELQQSVLFKPAEKTHFQQFGNDIQDVIGHSNKFYTWSNGIVYRTGALGLFKMATGPFTLMATREITSKDQIKAKIIDAEINQHNATWKDYMELLPS